jgi:hypothetical protein
MAVGADGEKLHFVGLRLALILDVGRQALGPLRHGQDAVAVGLAVDTAAVGYGPARFNLDPAISGQNSYPSSDGAAVAHAEPPGDAAL